MVFGASESTEITDKEFIKDLIKDTGVMTRLNLSRGSEIKHHVRSKLFSEQPMRDEKEPSDSKYVWRVRGSSFKGLFMKRTEKRLLELDLLLDRFTIVNHCNPIKQL